MPSRHAYELGDQPCRDFKPRDSECFGHNVHECFAVRPRRAGDPDAECGGTVSFCENCMSDHHAFGYERCGTPAAEGWDEYREALAAEMPHLAPRPGDDPATVRKRNELMAAVSDARARGLLDLAEHLASEGFGPGGQA